MEEPKVKTVMLVGSGHTSVGGTFTSNGKTTKFADGPMSPPDKPRRYSMADGPMEPSEHFAKASDASDWTEGPPGVWKSKTLGETRRQKIKPGSRGQKQSPRQEKAAPAKPSHGKRTSERLATSSRHDIADVKKTDIRLRESFSQWNRALSSKERAAMQDYVTPGTLDKAGFNFRSVNAKLRKGESLTDDEREWINRIDDAITKAGSFKKPINVYRGITVRTDISEFLAKFKEAQETGQYVHFQGVVSTSLLRERAVDYASQGGGSVVFEIQAKTGAYVQPWTDKYRGTKMDEWSQNYEVVQSYYSNYKVRGVREERHDVGDDQVSELNALPPNEAAPEAARREQSASVEWRHNFSIGQRPDGKWTIYKKLHIIQLEEQS